MAREDTREKEPEEIMGHLTKTRQNTRRHEEIITK